MIRVGIVACTIPIPIPIPIPPGDVECVPTPMSPIRQHPMEDTSSNDDVPSSWGGQSRSLALRGESSTRAKAFSGIVMFPLESLFL